MTKKRVASWIVTGVLVAGAGAALAEENDPVVTDETVPTTVVDTTTTTTVESTTTTVEDVTPTTVVEPEDDVDVDGEGAGGGNSVAAQNHDCDEAWGNHGAWVRENAHAMKTGETVSCDGPATTTTVAAATESGGMGKGHGKGGGKKQK